jgi:hypothetical protein
MASWRCWVSIDISVTSFFCLHYKLLPNKIQSVLTDFDKVRSKVTIASPLSCDTPQVSALYLTGFDRFRVPFRETVILSAPYCRFEGPLV